MAAIWGKINLKGTDEKTSLSDVSELMCAPYNQKCRLDKINEYTNDNIYMGCGLIYVNDFVAEETMPVYDKERQIILTADCIIDNREELIASINSEIKGVLADKYDEISDGAILVNAYRIWGIDFLYKLRGLFSIAIYDIRTNTLTIASDPLSSRCIYYYQDGADVYFSTLLAPILNCNSNIKVNKEMIFDYLCAPGLMPNISATDTPYENVFKVEPGCCITFSFSENLKTASSYSTNHISKEIRHYYSYGRIYKEEIKKLKTAKQIGDKFKEIFLSCVEDAIKTTGDVAISLSSGLDSASVGAVAARSLSKQNKKLYTYTYVPYENNIKKERKDYVYDETEDVGLLTAMYPNMVAHFLNNKGKNFYSELEKGIDIMEIPYKAFVNIPNLCEIYDEAHKQGCRVVLTGQAGNSTISHGYIDDVLYDIYSKKKFFSFIKYLNHYSKTVGESRRAALKGCINYFNYANEVYSGKQNIPYQIDNQFINKDAIKGYDFEKRFKEHNIPKPVSVPLPSNEYRDNLFRPAIYSYLGEFETKLGLANGIILRDPTMDIRIMDFCYNLPYKYFAYEGVPRWLIRFNLSDLLPDRYINDWMRYGVQNSDSILRIRRDWEEIKDEIVKKTESSQLYEFMNADKINEFITSFTSIDDNEADYLLTNLITVCVAAKFI